MTSGSVTTTTDGQYIFGAMHVNNTLSMTPSPGTGYTGREVSSGGGDTPPGRSEDRIQTTAGAIAATFTISTDQPCTTAIITLPSTGGGGPTTPAGVAGPRLGAPFGWVGLIRS